MWNPCWTLFWLLWVTVGLTAELVALLDRSPATPPLTWVIVRYVPWWIGMTFFSWALVHFLRRYRRRREYLREKTAPPPAP